MTTTLYQLECLSDRETYIGTTKDLKKREEFHVNAVKNFYELQPLHLHIINNGGWDNWVLTKVKNIRDEDMEREQQELMYDMKNCGVKVLNKNEQYLSQSEQKEKDIFWNHKQWLDEKEKRRLSQQTYNQKNREKNKEKQKEKYENNKDEINKKKRLEEKIHCECCNTWIKKSNMKYHIKTKKHYGNSACRID